MPSPGPLALKTLLYAPAGSIAAAATTSLPETVGGPKNYDYRYAWVRDCTFTLDALIRLGLREEVHSSLSWLLGAVLATAPDTHVFYRLDRQLAGAQAEVTWRASGAAAPSGRATARSASPSWAAGCR
ncbi:MAG: glycoside hydrolase family 15 protein [Streptosporangiaceae bacterium]